jgi:hypothetical protein
VTLSGLQSCGQNDDLGDVAKALIALWRVTMVNRAKQVGSSEPLVKTSGVKHEGKQFSATLLGCSTGSNP